MVTPVPNTTTSRPLLQLEKVAVRFRPAARAARRQPGNSPRPDGGGHRRERLRQDGAAEDDHRPAAARRAARSASTAETWPRLSERELTRQRIRFGFLFQQAALFDSMTIAQNVGFSSAPAHRQVSRRRFARSSRAAGGGRTARKHPEQEAGGVVRRDAEAGGPGPGPGDGAGNHALRRADHRAWTRS